MEKIQLLFTGKKIDVDSLLNDLKNYSEIVKIESRELKSSPSILQQRRQRQFDIYTAVVSISLSMVSSAAYEGIKIIISNLSKKREVVVQDESDAQLTAHHKHDDDH